MGMSETTSVANFTESYASFNRLVNSLQRQYIELNEFTVQNERLVQVNKLLVAATSETLAATEFLNGILKSISAGVIAVDKAGCITHFNPAASRLLGIPLKDPTGKLYRDTIPVGEPIEANALRASESGQTVEGVEKRVDLSDGSRLYLSVSTALLHDKDGMPSGAVEMFHDLTKVKKMEQEIGRLAALAALGEMAATIAHEVRNPLAGIGGFASLLKRDISPDDPRHLLVTKIIRGVDSLNQTVTTLLNYTRNESLRRERVDYNGFLQSAVDHFKADNPAAVVSLLIRLDHSAPHNALPVVLWCDAILCRQVFSNLLLNAAEACRGVGEIVVSYRCLPRQLAAQRYGDRIILGLDETLVETIFSDSGPGLSREAEKNLFAPFFTTKVDGNGLGLAVAAKVIKAHGGDILARNGKNGGAEFVVLLPTLLDTSLRALNDETEIKVES